MFKFMVFALVALASTAIALPANYDKDLEAIPLRRVVRSPDPDPHHHHRYNNYGGSSLGLGFGVGFGAGLGGGNGGRYGGGHGNGYGHQRYNDYYDNGYNNGYEGYNNGYNNYDRFSGGQSSASASAGAINTPFGGASFASANANSRGSGR